jgi:PAS domain S-box-containing protein
MPAASVFIVEDEAIVAEDLRGTLEKLGYSITGIAATGESAVRKIRETRPDLVLMDIHLAGKMDGIETAQEIRAWPKIPVIYLTAHADDESLRRAKVTEPYGYVLKPYDERELHSVIEMALYKHRMEQIAKENERTIRALVNSIPDAVMLLDPQQNIIALNRMMAQRFGQEYVQIIGHPVSLFNGDGSLNTVVARADEVKRSYRTARYEEREGDHWFEIAIYPISDPGRNISRIMVQYHDITDRKEFEEHLAKEGIARVEQNMEQFQILNDQIRNPLQAISGYIDIDCDRFRPRIMEQIMTINSLVSRLDQGWVESEKVRRFLFRHYHHGQKDKPVEDSGGITGFAGSEGNRDAMPREQ